MRIKDLRVRNFTSLIDVNLSNLPDLVVLIGKNSSGKSNLIDALALLFTEFGTRVKRELGSLDNYHHLFPNHNTQTSQPPEIAATITLTSEEWTKLLDIDQDTGRAFGQKELYVAKRIVGTDSTVQWETGWVEILGTESFEIVRDGEIVSEGLLVQPDEIEGNLTVPILIQTSQFMGRLGALLKSSLEVIHTTGIPQSWPNRFQERPTIIEPKHVAELWSLSQSSGNQRQPWTRVAKQYTQVAPNEQRPVGVNSSIQMEEGTLTVPIGMTGEGSQAMLRLIDQLDRSLPIIAIEEPETHLHPASIKQMG